MKLTAQLIPSIYDGGQGYYGLCVNGVPLPQQVSINHIQTVGELDTITVTFQGRRDEHGVLQLGEVKHE